MREGIAVNLYHLPSLPLAELRSGTIVENKGPMTVCRERRDPSYVSARLHPGIFHGELVAGKSSREMNRVLRELCNMRGERN